MFGSLVPSYLCGNLIPNSDLKEAKTTRVENLAPLLPLPSLLVPQLTLHPTNTLDTAQHPYVLSQALERLDHGHVPLKSIIFTQQKNQGTSMSPAFP